MGAWWEASVLNRGRGRGLGGASWKLNERLMLHNLWVGPLVGWRSVGVCAACEERGRGVCGGVECRFQLAAERKPCEARVSACFSWWGM